MKLIFGIIFMVFIKSSILSIRDKYREEKVNSSFQYAEPDYSIDVSKIVRSTIPLYVDVVAVITENSINLFRDANIDIEKYFADVFAGVAKVFSWHNIHFSIARMEYWEGENKPNIGDETINNYVKYFTENNYTFDTHVVFGHMADDYFVGLGFVGKLCTTDSVALISTSSYLHDPIMASYVVAHEIGHNMGFEHTDDLNECSCAANDAIFCLMNSFNEEWKGVAPKSIENCRMIELINSLHKYPCLLNPLTEKRLYSRCGDGVLDEGEDCDCGFGELCNNVTEEHRCCNMDTCKFLRATDECSSGQCCKNCQFLKGKLCRESYGECDAPEHCDGSSSECPTDIITKNYDICNNDEGFCYNGMCTNLNYLCQYAYNDETAYFSTKCVLKAKDIIQRCNDPQTPLYKTLCNSPNICQHFICSRPRNILKYTHGFSAGDTVCILPSNEIRIGLLKFASNYMKCSENSDHFCFNGECTNNTELLNICADSKCKPINNKNDYEMKKILYFPPFKVSYKFHQYPYNMSSFLNNLFQDVHKKNKSSYVTIVLILLGIGLFSIIAICLFLFIKRNRQK